MSDKIKINLHIGNLNYPLTIDREEEAIIREAARQVNLRLNTYQGNYPGLESEKIWGMVAYDLSLENLKHKERNDTEPYTEKIKELTELLEDQIKEKE